ncbi:ribosomal protein S18-alanine N-acetyltransferase [Bartonella ancashensis]|uniref:Ribosomal-protein-S18p-alanine acetyltransferase n=1 Tax=Bartonella ancashensis TaxID=1318743 RepID=A0A0M4LG97_9HYPH|nr:ribosomal protein S18-alanine N-acetyltransferase [Bartonella ancashensis]ALE03407.1 Ribosomal-protein-S18p-alanine acetyltransferase [Bartonella ancashensis]
MANFLYTKNHIWVTLLHADDSASLHKIHKSCFFPAWKKHSFDLFLKDSSIFGYKACFTGHPHQILGFCLCRLVLDEAEIITIAVHPHHRQKGIGYLLIDHTLRHLYHERAAQLFLEVEETNFSALALYKRFNFKKIAKRLAYYPSEKGRVDAIIMQKTFKQKD